MCHFITATLPGEIDPKKAVEIFARHKLGFKEIENESVRHHLEPGDIYILTTSGHCDCGTVLGSQYRDPELTDEQKESFRKRDIEKLKKKGWSQAKIDRWLKEAELTADKEKRGEELEHEYGVRFASDWVAFIGDILSSKVASRVGLLVHSYSGGLGARIPIAGKKQVNLKELNENVLLRMSEDVIYEFVRA